MKVTTPTINELEKMTLRTYASKDLTFTLTNATELFHEVIEPTVQKHLDKLYNETEKE